MNSIEKLRDITRRLNFLEFPVCVYVVTLEGQIIEANRHARLLFQLPPTGIIEKSIHDFCTNPADQERLTSASEAPRGEGNP